MAEVQAATADQVALLEAFVGHGLLIESGVPGVYGRNGAFEDVRDGVDRLISRAAAADQAEHLRFPPVLPRRQLESTGYLGSFPHLAGTIFAFSGGEVDALAQDAAAAKHEDWSGFQAMTDLVLLPAACYPVYPAIARRGPLPAGGQTIDTGAAYVFRREPSGDPARLQMFQQRELVRFGAPATVTAWRDRWRDLAVDILRGIGLEASLELATDPFFGRSGRMLAANQLAQSLKFEVLVPIAGPRPTAVASFNYHQDHFAHTFGIVQDNGDQAHTACLGFGLERIVMGLFRAHGLTIADWPPAVRAGLWP